MLLFIDTETTGKYDFRGDPGAEYQPHVVQLAAILCDADGKERALLHTLIRPSGWTMPAEAQEVHGISEEDCRKFGIRIDAALGALAGLCDQAGYLIAHNVDFDAAVLVSEYCRWRGIAPEVFRPCNRHCTMKASTPIVRLPGQYGDFKWPKLAEAYKHFFNEELAGAHDALADVRACARIYFELQREGMRG